MFDVVINERTVVMNIETYRAIVGGQCVVHTCIACHGQGKYFMDDEDNVYVHNPNKPGTTEWDCPDCHGVGFNLTEKT